MWFKNIFAFFQISLYPMRNKAMTYSKVFFDFPNRNVFIQVKTDNFEFFFFAPFSVWYTLLTRHLFTSFLLIILYEKMKVGTFQCLLSFYRFTARPGLFIWQKGRKKEAECSASFCIRSCRNP